MTLLPSFLSSKPVEKLWPEMAEDNILLQLDILYILLTLLTLQHAIHSYQTQQKELHGEQISQKSGILYGISLISFLIFHTMAFEHLSIFVGGTHCHATSPYLPMITPCSSINSTLFYIPWLYTSLVSGRRLYYYHSSSNTSNDESIGNNRNNGNNTTSSAIKNPPTPRWFRRYFLYPMIVGLLQLGFGGVYEMQGPVQSFWKWPSLENETKYMIADSPLLIPYQNHSIFSAAGKKGSNDIKIDSSDDDVVMAAEVGTISSSGIFRTSLHVMDALEERQFEFPVFAPYFHFAYGFGWAFGLVLIQEMIGKEKGLDFIPSLGRCGLAGILCFVLFLPPIWITMGFSYIMGISFTLGILWSLSGSFILVVWMLYSSVATEKAKKPTTPSYPPPSTYPDSLLFVISLIMHAFFVSFPWRNCAASSPLGLRILVATLAMIHLSAQYYICFVCGVEERLCGSANHVMKKVA